MIASANSLCILRRLIIIRTARVDSQSLARVWRECKPRIYEYMHPFYAFCAFDGSRRQTLAPASRSHCFLRLTTDQRHSSSPSLLLLCFSPSLLPEAARDSRQPKHKCDGSKSRSESCKDAPRVMVHRRISCKSFPPASHTHTVIKKGHSIVRNQCTTCCNGVTGLKWR